MKISIAHILKSEGKQKGNSQEKENKEIMVNKIIANKSK